MEEVLQPVKVRIPEGGQGAALLTTIRTQQEEINALRKKAGLPDITQKPESLVLELTILGKQG